jgi:vancomycin resistance protein VanJ
MYCKWFRLITGFSIWVYVFALLVYLILRLFIGDGFWLLAWMNNFAPYYFLPLFILLPLASFVQSRALKTACIALSVFGTIWFLPQLIPNNLFNSVPSYEITLKVVTFNVWGANQQLDAVVTWLREVDADVVLVQEVPLAWAGQGVQDLQDLYPYQLSQPPEIRLAGDAILSRYPIVAHEQYDLHNGYLANDRIEIEIDGQVVAIYNIHLYLPQIETLNFRPPIDNPFLNMVAKYNDTTRNNQINQLLDILESENKPFIVAGDFNMSDQAVKYSQFAQQLNDSFREAGVGLGATWPNAEIVNLPTVFPPLLRIDYIWHSDAWVTLDASVGPKLGSDHLPVIATLGLIER